MSGRAKTGTHWRRPATHVYDYNYNLGEHYYKPQLRHMEQKHFGRANSPPKAKTFAERFAEDPVHGWEGCPRTWRPATEPSRFGPPRRSSLTDDFGKMPSGGDIFSSGLDDRGKPRFSLGDRLLDSVGVSPREPGAGVEGAGGASRFGRVASPSPRVGFSSPGIMDDAFADPFFQRSKRFGKNEGPQSADPDFMTENPFKSRRAFDADDMMDDMKLDAENQVARFRSKMRAKRAQQDELLESGGGDDFGSAGTQSAAERIRARAKARMTELEDDFPSISLQSGRGKDSSSLASRLMNDMESSGSGSKSIRISKRTVRTVEN